MSEKLVRDSIVDFVFKQRGEILNTRVASSDELLTFLKYKIVEEANEVFNAKNKEELVEEMADLLEVMKALASNQSIVDEMFLKRESKYSERGGFEKGIILIGDCKK